MHCLLLPAILAVLFHVVDDMPAAPGEHSRRIAIYRNENVWLNDERLMLGQMSNYNESLPSGLDTELTDILDMCSPFVSCSARCGTQSEWINFPCNCDEKCQFFNDCCPDYKIYCESPEQLSSPANIRSVATCGIHSTYPSSAYLLIANCSTFWSNLYSKLSFNAVTERGFCTEIFPKNCSREDECSSEQELCRDQISNDCATPNMNNSLRVQDSEGYVYRSSSCALCNGQLNYFQIHNSDHESNQTNSIAAAYRACDMAIATCPDESARIVNKSLSELCTQHSGKVLGPKTGRGSNRTRKIYKNVYCALCNGEDFNQLSCPYPNVQLYHNWQDTVDVEADSQDENKLDIVGTRLDDIPAAFSILLNFGLDGRRRMLISSEGEEEVRKHQKLCGQHHIWDPFNKVCRKLFCSKEFDLVDFRCVKREDSSSGNDSYSDDSHIIDGRSDFVHLSLNMEMDMFDLLSFYGRDTNFTEIIANAFAEAFHIKIDRIRNVKVNVTLGNVSESYSSTSASIDEFYDPQTIVFSIDFDLYESSKAIEVTEPTVDSIVSVLASSLSVNGFDLAIDNVRTRIFEIHQTIDFFRSWCTFETGGVRKEYWNSDFTLIMNNDFPLQDNFAAEVYINKTEKTYYKGQFVANILFQGYRLSDNMINISGVVIVCERETKLDESCTRIMLEKHEYVILDNGTLQILNISDTSYSPNTSVYEMGENNSVFVCLRAEDSAFFLLNNHLQFDVVQAYVSLVLLCISIFALAIVLITYSIFSSLRNLPGCSTMNLTFSLLAMQVTFILGQRNTVTGEWCKFVAKLLHYEILCSFMWMNVMAYDLYKTFGNNSVLKVIRSKNKFLVRYMIYAYLSPVFVIATCLLLEEFLGGWTIAPHYGMDDVCWIVSRNAAFLFFAMPVGIVMIVNFVLYALTIKAVREVKFTVSKTTKHHKKPGWNDVILYARMGFVTGLTWTLVFIAAYVHCDRLIGQIVTYLFIVFNTLQGLFLFFAFVCNKRVFSLYLGLLKRAFRENCNVNTRTTSGILRRLERGMDRTISTETVVSTVSSISRQISGKEEAGNSQSAIREDPIK